MKTPRISNVVTCLLLIAFLIVAFAYFISPNSNLPVLSHAQNIQSSTTVNTEEDGAKHDEKVVEYAKMNRAVMRDIKFDSATTRIDFEYDRVEVILKQGFSKGTINAKSLLSISNIKSAEGIIAEDIVNAETEKTRNDRFRQIITIKLEKTGRDKVLEAVAKLEKLDEVLVAQPSYIYEGGDDWFPPNDPLYGGTNHDQWGLRGANGIKAEQAWSITKGDTNPLLRIGIFETGIQIDHPDLRVVPGNFTPEEGASSDHGTHVGGTIGAITHNGRGIAGIAQVELSLLNRSTFRESLEWADAQGISIVNASYWHDRPTVNGSGEVTRQAVPDALNFQAIANYSGLFVASAGNQGLNNDVFPQYPAAYDLPNLIAVGSIDENGGESSFSNFGADSVHIFAPGGSVLSSFPVHRCEEGSFLGIRRCEDNRFLWWGAKTTHIADGYHRASGTSFAAPHVAGVAALILSKYPELPAWMIKDIITGSVDPVPGLSERCISGGRLNAYKAVKNANDYFSGVTSHATLSGDFDGDDNQDIAMVYGQGINTAIAVWSSTGTGLEYRGIWWQSTEFYIDSIKDMIVSGDFDGDGKDEIIAFYDYGLMHTASFIFKYNETLDCFNDGSGYVTVWESTVFDANAIRGMVVSGNFHKGRVGEDEIIAFYNNGVSKTIAYIFYYDGTSGLLNSGTARYPIWSSASFSSDAIRYSVVAGNFDGGDRDRIIAFYTYSGNHTAAFIFWYNQNTTLLNDDGYSFYSIWESTSFDRNTIKNRIAVGDFAGNNRDAIITFYEYGATHTVAFIFEDTSWCLNDGSSFIPIWESTAFPANPILSRVVTGSFTGSNRDEILAFQDNEAYLFWRTGSWLDCAVW